MGTCASSAAAGGAGGDGKGSKGTAIVDVKGKGGGKDGKDDYQFYAIEDRYNSLEEVSEALRNAGLESSQLVGNPSVWRWGRMFAGRKRRKE